MASTATAAASSSTSKGRKKKDKKVKNPDKSLKARRIKPGAKGASIDGMNKTSGEVEDLVDESYRWDTTKANSNESAAEFDARTQAYKERRRERYANHWQHLLDAQQAGEL